MKKNNQISKCPSTLFQQIYSYVSLQLELFFKPLKYSGVFAHVCALRNCFVQEMHFLIK